MLTYHLGSNGSSHLLYRAWVSQASGHPERANSWLCFVNEETEVWEDQLNFIRRTWSQSVNYRLGQFVKFRKSATCMCKCFAGAESCSHFSLPQKSWAGKTTEAASAASKAPYLHLYQLKNLVGILSLPLLLKN